MKISSNRAMHLVFWVLFVGIGATAAWRMFGNHIPAIVVLLLALLIAVFAIYAFLRNMQDAKDAWDRAPAPGQINAKNDQPDVSPSPRAKSKSTDRTTVTASTLR
jgi:hypothetical protein